MKKIFNLLLSTLLLSLVNIEITHAADNENYGMPEILKITMKKVELCTGFQGGDFHNILTEPFCNDPLVVGSVDKEVDIASVDAGLAAASYGEPALLPLGETYTHLRVTFGKKFTMKGASVVSTGSGSGDSTFCATKITTDAMYGGGSGEAGKKYTHRVGVDAVGGANVATEEMNLYWVNGQKSSIESGNTFTHCYGDNCGDSSATWRWGYPETASGVANTSVANSIPRASVATDDMVNVYPLSSPYTIKAIPPIIDIAFSTSEALLVYEASKQNGSGTARDREGKCAFTVGKVFVKITMKDSEVKRSRGELGDK